MDAEFERFRATGYIEDEGSPQMAFAKSTLFSVQNWGRGINENVVFPVVDTIVGAAELEFNAKLYALHPDGDFLKVEFPTVGRAARSINEHYARGGTWAEVARPAVRNVLTTTFTMGGNHWVSGAAEYVETGNPTAWQESTGPLTLFAFGVARSNGVLAPPEVAPTYAGPMVLRQVGPEASRGSAVGDPALGLYHQQLAWLEARLGPGKPGWPGANPAQSPPGTVWRGKPGSTPGGTQGNYHNPGTGESFHPDLNHPQPIGPHWDYRAPDGRWYRIMPDGTMLPK